MTDIADVVGMRHATPKDRSYICHTWLKNYLYDALGLAGIDKEVLLRCHRQVVYRLLDTHTTVVAYDPKDSRVVVGFLCGDDYPSSAVIHYAYVRRELRKHGIATTMAEHLGWTPGKPIMGTHNTKTSHGMSKRMPILYNPYLAYQEFAGVLSGRTTRGYQASVDQDRGETSEESNVA